MIGSGFLARLGRWLMTFITSDTRQAPPPPRFHEYAWVSPSPRVRCRNKACITLLYLDDFEGSDGAPVVAFVLTSRWLSFES